MSRLRHLLGLRHALATFLELRRTPRRFASREAFLAWQGRALARWLREAPGAVRAHADTAAWARDLRDYPVMDKARLMADFAAFNRAGVDAEAGWAAFAGDRMVGPFHVGASTGTSGNRGLYVISEAERQAWLGAILAKALPEVWKPWTPRERVAVILPLHTRLYDAANDTGRIRLRFFDLTKGPEAWTPDLVAFAPTTIVAPPKILRALAEGGVPLSPRRLFSGAEVLDPVDRQAIEARFPVPLGQIYMATEGLLAVSCPHGRLHLCEDILHFELEPVPGTDLVSPLITDFHRRTQVMLRYRMNDLLRISREPCRCGSPCLVVAEVVGRQDDAFEMPGARGPVVVTPDVLRNAVLDADRRIADFRITQAGPARVVLALAPGLPDEAADRAAAALARCLHAHGVAGLSLELERRDLPPPLDRKLRRVSRAPGAPR